MQRVNIIIVAGALAGGVLLGVVGGEAIAKQQHMTAALGHMNAAKTELSEAANDKGGYKAQAMGHLNQAIDATRKGIAAGAT